MSERLSVDADGLDDAAEGFQAKALEWVALARRARELGGADAAAAAGADAAGAAFMRTQRDAGGDIAAGLAGIGELFSSVGERLNSGAEQFRDVDADASKAARNLEGELAGGSDGSGGPGRRGQ